MANQHFFQPLLPGFHSHSTIPVAFFIKNVEGKGEKKTAKLRSDASKATWEVKIDGQKLTQGWKEFAVAHDLRIGDIVIFRQERDMTFHVTMLGPSCCEIQHVSCLKDQKNLWKTQRKKRVRTNPRIETESCFVANISASTLRYDRLDLPRGFVRKNGLGTRRCQEIVLMNEKGRSWVLELRGRNAIGTTYITRGWRSFCHANELSAGSFSTFKLIQRGKTPVLHLASTLLEEEEEKCSETNGLESLSTEPESDGENRQDENSSQECSRVNETDSSSTSQNRFVTVTLTYNNVSLSRLVLPIPFTKVNDIKHSKKMSLMDKQGVKWPTKLFFEKRRNRIRLGGGWKEFCEANGLKIGESIILELIWETDKSSVLMFNSKVMPKTK